MIGKAMTKPLAFAALLLTTASWAADLPGAKDHPSIKRFEGSEIVLAINKNFDEVRFGTGPAIFDYEKQSFPNLKFEAKEGKRTSLFYICPADASPLEVLRNYQNELKAQGFQMVFEGSSAPDSLDNGYDRFLSQILKDSAPETWLTPLSLSKDFRYLAAKKTQPNGSEMWVSVFVAFNSEWSTAFDGRGEKRSLVRLDVIETKPMEQRMVQVSSAEMAKGIDTEGKIALYGIFFDTDKANLKPESDQTLNEIAALLKGEPDLKLLVVGHTDAEGAFEYNRSLSEKRAASVVAALTSRHGISKERLFPFGVSYASPMASNSSDEGRAKNRRVELVRFFK